MLWTAIGCLALIIIVLALAVWVAYQVFIATPQHGFKQLEEKSESSSFPDPPSSDAPQYAVKEEAHVPSTLWGWCCSG